MLGIYLSSSVAPSRGGPAPPNIFKERLLAETGAGLAQMTVVPVPSREGYRICGV